MKKKRRNTEKEEEKKIVAIRTEQGGFINRFRKKKEKMDKNITMERWSQHFMEQLGGIKERKILEEREEDKLETREEEGKEEREGITKEKLIEVLKKLKRRKAPGENGIENEVWRLMPKEIEQILWKLIDKIWKERGVLEWNKGVISPIYKKGERDDVKNYREITLMDTARYTRES